MLVRVKKLLGNYGHVENGVIIPKTYSSGAFQVSEEKGRELIARGIVDAVGAENAPAVTAPAPAPAPVPAPTPELVEAEEEPEEMTLKELRALARERGMKGYARLSKQELIRELEQAEEEEGSPTFDATGGVA